MDEVLAAADIGSNTAHLLVGKVTTKGLVRIVNESVWLSLGQVVSHEGAIPPELIDKLADALNSFHGLAARNGARSIYVFATEAVRRAKNHQAVLRQLQRQTGLTVEIVTPDREAALGLKGALLDSSLTGRFVLAESGGGSVQVALCDGPEIIAERSLPLGTGVLIDQANLGHPATPAALNRANHLISEALANLGLLAGEHPLLVCGGVARGLWRALHPDGERTLHVRELEYLVWSAARLNLSAISARYGVKPKRAATLVPGSLVYLGLMDRFHQESMRVSQFGVREGAILEVSQGKIVACEL